MPDDPGIFVTSISPGSPADVDQRLRPGDKIVKVLSAADRYRSLPFMVDVLEMQ